MSKSGYNLTSDGGVSLINERGTLDLSKHQLAVIYYLGKQEMELRERREAGFGIDWQKEAEAAAVEQRKIQDQMQENMLAQARSEIELLKSQLTVERGVNDALKLEIGKYRDMEKSRTQGYEPMREVMELRGKLMDAERRAAEAVTQRVNLEAALKRERDDHNRTKQQLESIALSAQLGGDQLRAELKKERDEHQALKYQVADLQKISQSFNELKKTITSFWNR